MNQSCSPSNNKLSAEPYLLDQEEVDLALRKLGQKNQFVFAIMLKFFERERRFPTSDDDLPDLMIEQISWQLNCHSSLDFDQNNRSYHRFRKEISQYFGYRKCQPLDRKLLITWLIQYVFPEAPTWEQVQQHTDDYFRERKLGPLSNKQLDRILRSAHGQFESNFFKSIESLVSTDTKYALDRLIGKDPTEEDQPHTKGDDFKLNDLKKDSAELKINSILDEVRKYRHLCTLNIPKIIGSLGSRKVFLKYYKRVQAELPSHIRAHPPHIRYAYLTIFCLIRSQICSDTLVDLLLKIMHRIRKKAEKHVEQYILSEVRRVDGKFDTLFLLAQTSIEKPLGIIEDEIYSHVSLDKLKDVVHDLKYRGKWFKNQVQLKGLSIYSHNNRHLVWILLNALSLQADHPQYKEILQALDWIREKNKTDKLSHDNIPVKDIPFQRVFESSWLSFIKDSKDGDQTNFCIHKNAYELALFERLSEELGCKNIWAEGGYRYRNPMHDSPKDFYENITHYFQLVKQPENGQVFVDNLRNLVEGWLKTLNDSIPGNPKVTIKDRKGKGAIKVSPSPAQEEPTHLTYLHNEIAHRWPSTSLMDILKEADYLTQFTDRFQSIVSRKILDTQTLKKRFLLSLYALGTNAGLKRVSAGNGQETYSDLRYVKRCFIGCQNVRDAIQDVVNAIIEIRDPKIWGIQLTGCACDSTKVNVWDQNLMVEWHTRYKGRGVMIYWHVDKKAACIYSQLKTCSSSEVGSMMKGFLDHDTHMEMNQIYVDTHGQSTIGFAFSHLFHFDLLPRLKNINRQKLYIPSKEHKDLYPNLTPALSSKGINWQLILNNYLEIIKIVSGLKTHTVEPDVIIKRFGVDNEKHPVYQALLEIGKAVRTVFLCRYLSCEELRIEIHESLNVVERVNGIMDFIFYGKLGELSTNNPEDQELSILCLHLLQVCMVYINTLMIQEVLHDPTWKVTLTAQDMRALSPLIHRHITPYGFFILDMNHRIKIVTPSNENYNDRHSAHPHSRKSKTIRKIVA